MKPVDGRKTHRRVERCGVEKFPHSEFVSDEVRFLEVTYDEPDDDFKFTAGAVWKRKCGQWRCVQAGLIIKWMVGMERLAAKLELARRGCSWRWVKELEFVVDPAKAGVLAPVDIVSHRVPKHEAQAMSDMRGAA